MHAYRIVWGDEAKAREIELFVDYSIHQGVVQIDAIRPTAITFYNAATKTADRTMRVHTATARRLLTDAFLGAREGQRTLEEEIQAQHDHRDEEFVAGQAL